jgi:hypothetical protein
VARDPFGPGFEKELDRELARTIMHSSAGREIEREHQRRPKQKQEESFKLRGAPGSPERWAQAVEAAGELGPSLAAEAALDTVGVELMNTIHAINAEESSPYFEGSYSPETSERFAAACRYLAASNNPQLYAAFEHELAETGSELGEYLYAGVEYA